MLFTPLILAGGRSSRMGSPKHLLSMPDGRPLYQHQIDLLTQVCPYAPTIYISLAPDSQLDDYLRTLPTATDASPDPDPVPCEDPHIRKVTPPAIAIIHDLDANTSSAASAGPVAGLLAAHRADPARTWLVIACDYPLLTQRALERLCAEYRPPVTCFRNADGFCEPLIGVWGPDGLAELERRVKSLSASEGGKGRRGVGPSAVIKALNGRELETEDEKVLMGVNTPDEWGAVQEVLATGGLAASCSVENGGCKTDSSHW